VNHGGIGVSAADYDANGYVDLYVTSLGSPSQDGEIGMNRLYRNNGNGTFTEVGVAAGVNLTTTSPLKPASFGSAWGDFDLDGDLDLCVASWNRAGDGNVLFRNNGNGTFTNVTGGAVGEAFTDPSWGVWGFQPVFADMNGDLYPELLMAADFETSRYLLNNGDGTFTDITISSGTGLDDNGMGQAVADVNNDGLLDWYVTSIYNECPSARFYNGNTLYLNLGNNLFQEVSASAGVNDGGWGWGTAAADFDHDGWVDLGEVNGRAAPCPAFDGNCNDGTGDCWYGEQEYLYYNNGDGTFTELAQTAGFDLGQRWRSGSGGICELLGAVQRRPPALLSQRYPRHRQLAVDQTGHQFKPAAGPRRFRDPTAGHRGRQHVCAFRGRRAELPGNVGVEGPLRPWSGARTRPIASQVAARLRHGFDRRAGQSVPDHQCTAAGGSDR
jgi:hypothetical protein